MQLASPLCLQADFAPLSLLSQLLSGSGSSSLDVKATYLLYLYSPQRVLFFSSVHAAQAEEQSCFAGHDKRYCSFHRWSLGTPSVPAVPSPRTSLEAPAEVQHPFSPVVALRGHRYHFSTRDGTFHKALQELAILDVTERDLSPKVQVVGQNHGLAQERSEEGFGSHPFPVHSISRKKESLKLFEIHLNARRDSNGLKMFENPKCKAIVAHYPSSLPHFCIFQSAFKLSSIWNP